MKRFDRLIAILLQLQTSRLLRAADLAARFDVSERTIYRDMRSLEAAGVPLVAETGLGYYLDRSYQLPAVNFSPDEAIALMIGVKGAQAHVPGALSKRAESAMQKLLAVMDKNQRDSLADLQARISIDGLKRRVSTQEDNYFDDCQFALSTRRTLKLGYTARYNRLDSTRIVEPIGLCHYGGHWHLIAWCQLREAIRDFRLDCINAIDIQAEHCNARPEQSLERYFQKLEQQHTMTNVKVAFDAKASHIVGAERYKHGYVGSEHIGDAEVMSFLTACPEYLARWLLQFTNAATVLDNPVMDKILFDLYQQLGQRTHLSQ